MRCFGILFLYQWMILAGLVGMLGACSDDEQVVSLRLTENIFEIQRFTWGQSRSYAVTRENVKKSIISAKPKGWTVTVDEQTVRITAPQTITGVGGTFGEVVITASNGGGDNSTIRIQVEIPTSALIDLSRPDLFKDSEVLLAVNASGDTLAEVCREYVRRDNVAVGQGIRAVVVYLYDSATKVFKRGFVVTNGGGVDHDGGNYQSAAVAPLQVVYIVEGVCCGSGNYEGIPVAQLIPQTVDDVEGNRYGVVKVGTQYWMRENLRTMTYNDGDAITRGASWYKDMNVDVFSSDKLKKMFGASYGYSVARHEALAPQGWRVANDEDWLTLERFIRMNESDLYSNESSRGEGFGDYLKSEGEEWADKGGGSNLTGLGITPGGATNNAIKIYAYVWSIAPDRAYFRLLNSTNSSILRRFDSFPYLSVRCVRKD